MKSLVEIKQPCDHYYQGRTIHINPDDIVTVGRDERHVCFIKLRDGTNYSTDEEVKAVVQKVKEAL